MTKLDISLKIAQQASVDDVVAKQIVQMTLEGQQREPERHGHFGGSEL